MSAAHTPTPWQVANGSPLLIGCDGFWIAGMMGLQGEVGEANARFIVHAVNCHDDLLTAATEAEWFLAHYAEYVASVPVDEIERHPYLPDLQEKVEMLRAAIAKALGRTPNEIGEEG